MIKHPFPLKANKEVEIPLNKNNKVRPEHQARYDVSHWKFKSLKLDDNNVNRKLCYFIYDKYNDDMIKYCLKETSDRMDMRDRLRLSVRTVIYRKNIDIKNIGFNENELIVNMLIKDYSR